MSLPTLWGQIWGIYLIGIIDENNNRFAVYGYDAQGRAISTEHAGGAQQATLAYNTDGSTTVTDALGTVRTYAFQTINGINKNTLSSNLAPAAGRRRKTSRTILTVISPRRQI